MSPRQIVVLLCINRQNFVFVCRRRKLNCTYYLDLKYRKLACIALQLYICSYIMTKGKKKNLCNTVAQHPMRDTCDQALTACLDSPASKESRTRFNRARGAWRHESSNHRVSHAGCCAMVLYRVFFFFAPITTTLDFESWSIQNQWLN